MSEPVPPNFLGIGVPKSATTWLAEGLRRHPEIFLSHDKELVYFSSEKKFSLGADWYLSHFAGSSDKKAIGEFSVTYLAGGDKVAQRIKSLLPEIRLIAVLRDPVERAFSHYRWLQQIGRLSYKVSFADALALNPDLIRFGLYHRQLSQYCEHFDVSRLLLLLHDDIRQAPDSVLSDTYRFLGVNDSFRPGTSMTRIGKTIAPRSRLVEDLRIKAHTYLRKRRLTFLISLAKRAGLSNTYRRFNDSGRSVQLGRADYLRASEFFLSDIEALRLDFGVGPESWLAWRELGQCD